MIDSHMHVNYKRMAAGDIIRYMDRERVDQCWLLTWEEASPPHPFHLSLPVEDVMEVYRKHGRRIVPMYAPDPARPDAAGRFMEWVGRGIRGCGELKCVSRWDSPELDGLLDCLDRLGFPLVFHMQGARRYYHAGPGGMDRLLCRLLNSARLGRVTGRIIEAAADAVGPLKKKRLSMESFFPGYLMDFAALEKRLAQYPDIKFIGHGPLFWRGFTAPDDDEKEGVVWKLMESYRNMHADLSASGFLALKKRPAMARRFLDRFSRKALYGTDNISIGLKEFLDSLGMGAEVCRRIYGENAEALLEGGREAARTMKRDRREREAA